MSAKKMDILVEAQRHASAFKAAQEKGHNPSQAEVDALKKHILRPDVVSEFLRKNPPGKKQVRESVLTNREREVAILIAQGLTNKEIAYTRLNIGVRTVETHRERIMRKLGVRGAAGIACYAMANNLVSF